MDVENKKPRVKIRWAKEGEFDKQWQPPETLPTEERVLGYYKNIWGFFYVTEVFKWSDEEMPETLIGMPINKLLGWYPLPDTPEGKDDD